MISIIEFDSNQNGNLRKAYETKTLFCAINFFAILKELESKNEVIRVAKKSDFKEMKEINEE